jgi:hypothetical protein
MVLSRVRSATVQSGALHLEPLVLLKLLQPADLGDAHTGELLLPPVKGRLAVPQLAAELLDRGPGLGLT